MERVPGSIILGKYQVIRKLGEGGFGVVYLANSNLGAVAIKELSPQKVANPKIYQEYQKRFQSEAEIGRNLVNNPNIVAIYELGQENGSDYLVMQYMDGGTLKDALDSLASQQTLPLSHIYRLAIEICSGLETVHNLPLEVVHRDLKPENILLTRNGQAKITDFGVAQIKDLTIRTDAAPRHHPGTAAYMSPEQAKNASYLTPASDLYTLGLILYEMVTTQNFKRYGTLPPSKLNPSIPPALDAIITKALQENPADRYRKASEMRQHLELALQNRLTPEQVSQQNNSPVDLLTALSSDPYRTQTSLPRNTQPTPTQPQQTTSPQSTFENQPAPEKNKWLLPVAGSVVLLAVLAIGAILFTGILGNKGAATGTPVAAAAATNTSVAIAPGTTKQATNAPAAAPVVATVTHPPTNVAVNATSVPTAPVVATAILAPTAMPITPNSLPDTAKPQPTNTSSPANGGVLFEDSLAKDAKPEWKNIIGDWVVSSGGYEMMSGVKYGYTIVLNPNWTDYVMTLRIGALTWDDNTASILLRVKDENNFLRFDLARDKYRWILVQDGKYPETISKFEGRNDSQKDKEQIDLRIVVQGNSVTAYTGKEQIGNFSFPPSVKANFATGGIGLLVSRYYKDTIVGRFSMLKLTTIPADASATPAPTPLPGLIFGDTLTKDFKPEWKNITGDWAVINGGYEMMAGVKYGYTIVPNPTWTDYVMTLRIGALTWDDNTASILLRVKDENNFLRFDLARDKYRWILVQDGKYPETISKFEGRNDSQKDKEQLDLRIVVQGNSVTAYTGKEQIGNFSFPPSVKANFATGGIGLLVSRYYKDTIIGRFSNLNVVKL
ncbi:MAG: serine/threonine protein kinase [Chloroflexi bacterium]|nr:serine/threonine protein kinase [Chloroflexota bacterium]